MTSNFYDVVVIGADIAASVAGALLSRRGFRVLCAGIPVEERYALGPYMLPHAPLAFVGLESPALRRVVSELNLVQLLRRRLEPNRPSYQLLLPDQRLDIGDSLTREVQRELPASAAGLEPRLAAMADLSNAVEAMLSEDLVLPPDGFWDRRDAQRIATRLALPGPDRARSLAEDPLGALSELPALMASDLASPGVIPCARLGDLYRRGTFRVDGGRRALHGLLQDRIRAHSGEVRPDLVPERIDVERGRVKALHFLGQSAPVGCDHVIAGLDPRALAALLADAPRRVAEAAAVPPRRHRYLLSLVAPIHALPDALSRIALSVGDLGQPLDGANLLALHVADGYGQHAILSVEALATDPSPAALATLRSEILARLNRILPFVAPHVLVAHSPHDGIATSHQHGDAPLIAPPAYAMDALYDFAEAPLLGICGLPHATGIKNLSFASRHVLPGLGLEGELQAGWTAARMISSKEKKRGVDAVTLSR